MKKLAIALLLSSLSLSLYAAGDVTSPTGTDTARADIPSTTGAVATAGIESTTTLTSGTTGDTEIGHTPDTSTGTWAAASGEEDITPSGAAGNVQDTDTATDTTETDTAGIDTTETQTGTSETDITGTTVTGTPATTTGTSTAGTATGGMATGTTAPSSVI